MTQITTTEFPAGTYWVGDLCYVLHAEWDEVCELFFAGRTDHGCNQGEFTLKDGRRFVAFNTAHGDGTYYDNRGRDYSVDAGLIGLIKFDAIDLHNEDNYTDGGQVIAFTAPFTCECEDGFMRFGSIAIDTDSVHEDDEEVDCDEE